MSTTLPATFAELRTALDYLPVAVRAADNNPGNTTLWAESVRAQRAVIEYADTHLDETEAAAVQAEVGAIARWSIANPHHRDLAIKMSATAKRRVLILTGAIDSYADMTDHEVMIHLDTVVVSGHLSHQGMLFMVRELRRRGTVHEDMFWWLVDRAREEY